MAPAASGVDADDVEVQRVRVARVARERRDAVEVGEALVVERELARADRRVVLELVELDERDRREDVGEVGLEAPGHLVVARAVAPSGEPHAPDPLGDVARGRRDQPSLTRGDVLRRVEREARRVREAAELAAAVAALEGVGRVLDDGEAERVDRVEVARLPREVDGQDRLRPLGDESRQELGVEVQVAPRARRRRRASRRSARSRSPSRAM